VVNNACATLAVLNGICNIPGLEMGDELRDLVSFTQGMDPSVRLPSFADSTHAKTCTQTSGLTVTSSSFLREAHNALTPPSSISTHGLFAPPKKSEDAFHFIVYIPWMGCIYELDGLKEAPIRHGVYKEEGEGWVAKARYVYVGLWGMA
jgi:ubiquitin carboxyl-terminal hydrolase L5